MQDQTKQRLKQVGLFAVAVIVGVMLLGGFHFTITVSNDGPPAVKASCECVRDGGSGDVDN